MKKDHILHLKKSLKYYSSCSNPFLFGKNRNCLDKGVLSGEFYYLHTIHTLNKIVSPTDFGQNHYLRGTFHKNYAGHVEMNDSSVHFNCTGKVEL